MKSCLQSWDEIAARIQCAPGLFIAFDFDGVLSPIASTPQAARLSTENHDLLKRLVAHPRVRVAVVSGRALIDVESHVDIQGMIYAGNHGAEISLSGKVEEHVSLERYRAALLKVHDELMPWVNRYPGLRIEDKGFGIGLHYREVAPQSLVQLQREFDEWSKTLDPNLRVFPAKMLFEIRPNVDWNKGSAVSLIWKEVNPEYLAFCLGDDRTDEDGFTAVKGRGISIFVGFAKESCADYFLETQADVTVFIQRLLDEAERAFGSTPSTPSST